MANYLDFVRILERDQKPKRLTYACGEHNVLVEEIVDAIRVTLDVSALNQTTMSADTDKPAAIWDELNRYALDASAKRLVVIREMQAMKTFPTLAGDKENRFEQWLAARTLPNTHVVMVAREREWRSDREPKTRERMMKSASALYVECNLSRSNPQKQAVEIIVGWSNMSREVAAYLAERSGYNLARCRDVCRWTNNMKGEVTPRLIDMLIQKTATESYAESLLTMHKAEAAVVAKELNTQDVRKTIGSLAHSLTTIDKVSRAMKTALTKYPESGKSGIAQSEAHKLSGVPLPVVMRLWNIAKHYDAQALVHRTELLVRADRHADKPGVLELLASEW